MLGAAREALAFARDRERAHLESDRMLALALVKECESVSPWFEKVRAGRYPLLLKKPSSNSRAKSRLP